MLSPVLVPGVERFNSSTSRDSSFSYATIKLLHRLGPGRYSPCLWRRKFLDLITRWHLEKRLVRFTALDVRKRICCLSKTRVIVDTSENQFKLRRIPCFVDNNNIPVISDCAFRDYACAAGSDRPNAINGLDAKRFSFFVPSTASLRRESLSRYGKSTHCRVIPDWSRSNDKPLYLTRRYRCCSFLCGMRR